MKSALIVGSTGLVGKQLLDLLLKENYYFEVKAVTRKPLARQHPKLKNIVLDFNKLNEQGELLRADDIFCCLGTTMKQAKSKEAFYKVDFEYPYHLAKLGKEHGATQFLLISALGANEGSSIFYNRVKGEAEAAISKIGFGSLHILRPSLLLGTRNENRAGEGTAILFYKIFGFLFPKKYQAIDSGRVASAMFALAKKEEIGRFIHESKELQVL